MVNAIVGAGHGEGLCHARRVERHRRLYRPTNHLRVIRGGAAKTYNYSIEHDDYGTIGTYSDTIEETGGLRRIDTRLRVAVKVLGITVYREDADRTELWQGDRLVSFHGLTTVNGEPIEVSNTYWRVQV